MEVADIANLSRRAVWRFRRETAQEGLARIGRLNLKSADPERLLRSDVAAGRGP